MKMKIFVKILLITLWLAFAAGAIVMLSFSKNKNAIKKCQSISCEINYQGKSPLLSENDLIQEVINKYGDVRKQKIGEIDLQGISSLVKNNPYLSNTDVLISVEGNLQIKALQSIPLVRFFAADEKQSYISMEGKVMPVNLKYPYKTLLATGEIVSPIKYGKSIFSIPDTNYTLRAQLASLYNIHYVSQLIEADSVLNSLIEQINITPSAKIQLVTKAGSHLILFGDTTLSAEKLENLKHFYKNALTKTGWNKYSKINLEYKNQIVCSK